MSEAEKLLRNQPAEIHVGGIPQYVGEISAVLKQGLLMSDTRPMRGKQTGGSINIHPGAKADLVFLELFDEEGERLIAPITLVSAAGTDVTLDFRNQVSLATGTVLRKLQAKPRTDPRADGAPVNAEILPELRKRALRQLDKILNNFFLSLIDHLFDMSSRPQSSAQQDELYEAMNIVKRNKDAMRKHYAQQIEAFFDDPTKDHDDTDKPESPSDELAELNLVDIQDFEDSLSLNRMVRMGEDKYAPALECLVLRFAELIDLPPLEVRLPIHVAQICEAFRATISERNIPHVIAPEVYGFFTEHVVRKLEAFYTSLNAFLRDRGVRTDIEEEVKKHGSILKRLDQKPVVKQAKPDPAPEVESPAEAAASESAAAKQAGTASQPTLEEAANLMREARKAGMGSAGGSQPDPRGDSGRAAMDMAAMDMAAKDMVDALHRQHNPDNLYRSVIDALNFRRSHAAAGDGVPMPFGSAPPPDAANVAGNSALASALNALQGDSAVRNQLQQQPSLRQYLSDNQAKISQLEGTSGFASDSLNQLDLVDNLFSDIGAEVDLAPELKPVVGDLQIPLAKLALLEPQFFANKNHPARGVIDKVAQLSASGNYPNKALENRVSSIIDTIVENYQNDSGVFQSALQELDKLSGQQQQALERNLERVVKTQDGQQKLLKARTAVSKILDSRIRPPHSPKPIVDLVNNGWRDLLTLTHVKQGPNSKAWKEYVKTLDLLSLWLIEQQKGGVSEQMQVERALESEPFIDMIRQQISEALPSSVAHEAVLDELQGVLSGRTALQQTEIAPRPKSTVPSPAEVRKKVDTLPRLRRWVKRVEELEKGSWLGFKDSDGSRRRMQLAWFSEDKDRYVFVNERGQKIADLTGVELARQLSRGVKPPGPTEDLPLVDQSMYRTLEHVQKSLSFDKNHDGLTKLINKETFLNQVDVALKHAKAKHASHALLYMDIDQFKIVNDVYDEVAGDQVLMEFAKLLSQQHGKKVSSARLGGDKFGVLLLDRQIDQAMAHAEAVRRDIEAGSVSIENDTVSFTVSIGVCAILDHGGSVDELMEHAGLAALQAKQEGRNRVARYHEDQNKARAYQAEEIATVARIQKTLDSKSFVLQAQPIARAVPREGEADIEHYEVLLSIADEAGELHSPQEFITSAERFGYMPQVDRWVVKQVFMWISKMMDEQKVVPNLSINLSGKSITDDNFMEYLFEQISEFGVGTNKICFEITESGTISNMIKATDFVNEFKNIGCKFSIDDFGTGLASHSYLRELPVDYVKIDGAFVANIDKNSKDYAMAKSINDLAHFLGQETIAEFVENDAIIEKLREIGVDFLQGWAIGRPTPLTKLSQQLELMEK